MATIGGKMMSDVYCNASLYLFIGIVAIFIYFIYMQLRNPVVWASLGIPQATMPKEGYIDLRVGCHKMFEKHGNTVGTFLGEPLIFTRDLDVLRHVMVKDFNNFVNRLFSVASKSPVKYGLVFQQNQEWKRVRQYLSPSFSTGKMKMFSKTVDESARKLTKVFEEFARRGQVLPIKYTTSQYTSEIIARLAFGLQTDCLGKEDDEFTHHSKTMFKIRNKFMRSVIILLQRFRKLQRLLVNIPGGSFFDDITTESNAYFDSVLHKTVQERQEYMKSDKIPFTDFFQSLVNAKELGCKPLVSHNQQEKQVDDTVRKMSDEELMGHAMLIIFAGFETTSTTLHMCLYNLAKHPDIQEKLYQEIRKKITSDNPTYEDLGELKYLSQVVDETLRLFPPAPIVNRVPLEDSTVGSITLPKGVPVMIPLELVMKDPQNFPNPEKFDPDRFSEENKAKRDPMSFMPFGYGPRLCLGMRLAYLEIKLGLVHVLRKIKFELNEHTHPKVGESVKTEFQGILVIDDPIQLALKLRSET